MAKTEEIENKLNRYKKEVDKLKAERAKLEGQNEALYERIKKEFNIDDFEDIYEKQKELEKELENLSKRYDKLLDEIEKEFNL